MSLNRVLAGCELLERIGAGAESAIYKARELRGGRVVAVKHLVVTTPENRKYLRHMRNEYVVLRALRQGPRRRPPEGIVDVYRYARRGRFRSRKEHIMVMQYVDGPDLRQEHRYPLGQMVDIFCQVASTIASLHSRGYLHGDLKPENIVVDHAGQATLVDFGFACKLGTVASSIRGTRDYLAPEQVSKGTLSQKTDLYNFGATMYFLLTGKHVPAMIPAQGDSALFITHNTVRTPPPRSLRPELPVALEGVVMRCLEKEPIMRPSCAEEVLGVLNDVRSRFMD